MGTRSKTRKTTSKGVTVLRFQPVIAIWIWFVNVPCASSAPSRSTGRQSQCSIA